MKTKYRHNTLTNYVKKAAMKSNPFDLHINRCKHQVLGQKRTNDRGLPGISRYKALQKRKQTLLVEYKMKEKNNHFIDRRIGERDAGISEDARIMARFTTERTRMFKKNSVFNLSDSEHLTHLGHNISDIESYEDTKSDDEDIELGNSGMLSSSFVEHAHFGCGLLTKSKLDRESLINELINEFKKQKVERQRNKEETLEATEQLDEEWKTIGPLIIPMASDTQSEEQVNNKKKDYYDILLRQLKYEPSQTEGKFQVHSNVLVDNDGPLTIILDSHEKDWDHNERKAAEAKGRRNITSLI